MIFSCDRCVGRRGEKYNTSLYLWFCDKKLRTFKTALQLDETLSKTRIIFPFLSRFICFQC